MVREQSRVPFNEWRKTFGLVVMMTDTIQFVFYGVKVQAQPSIPTSDSATLQVESDANSTIYQHQVPLLPPTADYLYSTKQT